MFVPLVLVACASVVVGVPAAGAATHTPAARSSAPKFTATGYFSVAQSKGRWWLVTPQGAPFYAAASDTVSPDGSGTDQVTGICPYCQTVANDYPSTAAWGTATLARLRSWGFNTLGAYSDNADLGSQMPYEVQLSMATGDDWFAPSFVTNADQIAATQVAPLADDPNLIGYFTDSELNWGVPVGGTDPLDEYLALPAGSPGLAVAQQYAGNPQGFLSALATRYFQVTTAAVRQYDPHHLILGVKAEGQEVTPALLEAASPYVDVFSIEDYTLQPLYAQLLDDIWPQYLPVEPNLADFEQYVKRPLMLGEYTAITPSPTTPSTHPGIYLTSPTQQERALAYESFIAPLYQQAPWLVGDDWFQYVDEPQNGRTGDGENDNFGMVDVNDQPYPTMVAAMQLMHAETAPNRVSSAPACDSWASTLTGVSCTATMPSPQVDPPTVVTDFLPEAYQWASFDADVSAAGGTLSRSYANPGYHFTITGGALPAGLKLGATTGHVTGKPKVSGTFSFTVTATDSTGSVAAPQVVSVTIAGGPKPTKKK
jgi:agarase